MIWGLDLGVRSFHAAGLSDSGELTLIDKIIKPPRSKIDNTLPERARELAELTDSLDGLLAWGDVVYIEEPPLSGGRNVRTFLKLSQTSGALAATACRDGVSVTFVPVDTWKMAICGKGGVSKEVVAAVLAERAPRYSAQCQGNQNSVDATCIALYGQLRHGEKTTALDTGLEPAGPTRGSGRPRSRAVGQRAPRTTLHVPRA